MWINGAYVTLDNVEFTGLRQTSGSTQSVAAFRDHVEVKNCYFHGWSRAAGQTDNGSTFAITANVSNGEAQVAGTSFHDNVIDGADTTKDMFNGIEFGDQVYNNVIRYVVSGLLGDFNDVHGNLVEHIRTSYAGDHCNGMFVFSPFNGSSNLWMYNNVVAHNECPGGMWFWLNGNNGCAGCTSYAYNNVLFDTAGRGIDIGSHPTEGTTGTYYIYNNTVESGGGACMGNGESSPRSTTNFQNNHCINSSKFCDGTGTTCVNLGNNLAQTMTQANSAGYSATQTNAYSPTAAGSSTVAAGANLTSSCSGNLSAMCSSITYPTYDSVNHRVVMQSSVPKPSTGAWDIGAYQFKAQGPLPNAPTSLGNKVN